MAGKKRATVTMIDAKLLGQVFRAAARGIMQPVKAQLYEGGSVNTKSYESAESMSSAFAAIATIFEIMAKAKPVARRKRPPHPYRSNRNEP